MLSAAENV